MKKDPISNTQAEKMRCQVSCLINGKMPTPHELWPALPFQFLSTVALLNKLGRLGKLIYWNGPVSITLG